MAKLLQGPGSALPLTCVLAFFALPAASTSLPQGCEILYGQGDIATQGDTWRVRQSSPRLELTCESFVLDRGASARIEQPSARAQLEIRVSGKDGVRVDGDVHASGHLSLTAPHGMDLSRRARVAAASVSFEATGDGDTAVIRNHGRIEAGAGGTAQLIGRRVSNDGAILAPRGVVRIEAAQPERPRSEHGDDDIVVNRGIIDVHDAAGTGGDVHLVATRGNAVQGGDIRADGVHGGSVQLLSDANVGVTGGSIDASGTLGGGSIRVGGGWQGGEKLQTANATYVAADARLYADATQQGRGGSVVVWGDAVNNFHGSVTARGGAQGGDGGRVETSSHDGLNAQGAVDASATQGAAGLWLLDPHNVEIRTGGTGTLGSGVFSAASDDSTIAPSTIAAALTGGTSVSVFTGTGGTQAGNITVTDPIVAAGAGTLYLQAAGSILLNSAIVSDGSHALNVNLWANYGGTAGSTSYTGRAACATCTVSLGAGITTSGGNVDIRTGDGTHAGGGATFGIGGNVDAGGGNLSITANGITQGATGSLKASAATLNTGGTSAMLTGANQLGTANLTGTGAAGFTLNNGSNAITLGSVSLGSGDLSVTAGGGIALGGSLATGGTQNYDSQVNLTANTTLTGSTVSLLGGIAGSHALTVNGNGAFAGTGSVGSLHVTGTSTLDGSLTTASTQRYDGAVTLGGDAYLDATKVTLGAGVQGGHALIVLGDASLAGSSNLGTISVIGSTSLAGSVTTSGAQDYEGAVTLVGDTTLDSGDTVGFGGAVNNNASATPRMLSITSTHGTRVDGNIGAAQGGLGGLAIDADTISLIGLAVAGNLALTTHGAGIAQNAGWTVGSAAFDAGTYAITLNDAGNDFVGAMDVTGGAVSITDSNALILGTVMTGGLTVTSVGTLGIGAGTVTGNLVAASNGGAITQGGALQVGGATMLDAGDGDVTLGNAGNDFGGAVDVTGGAIALRDANNLKVTSLAAGANKPVSLVAEGALDFGVMAIDTGTAALTLHSGATLATVANLNGGNVTLSGDGGLSLGASVTASGDLSLGSTDAAITQGGGTLSIGGGTTVDARTGNVTLVSASNDFSGTVNVTGGAVSLADNNALALGAVTASALTVTSTGALNLGAGTVTGNLVASSHGGAIIQGGALQVGGTTALDAGSGDVTLTDAGNRFAGVVSVTARQAALTGQDALGIGSASVATGVTLDTLATEVGDGHVLEFGNGNSTGSVSGSYAQQGALHLHATADGSDILAVQATAQLGGSLDVAFTTAPTDAKSFMVLSAGGVSGTFATLNVTGLPEELVAHLDYQADKVVLEVSHATHSVGGQVSGLSGSGLVLQINGGETLPITGNGGFEFPTPLAEGETYDVTVSSQPTQPSQECSMTNGQGTIGTADVTDIQVECDDLPPQLVLAMDDAHPYLRHGQIADYVVTLSNEGANMAQDVSVNFALSSAFDADYLRWQCFGGTGGASCTASATGQLDDQATLPPHRTLIWLVSVPVRVDTDEPEASFAVTVNGADPESRAETSTLVIMRDGFDVPYGDGTQAVGGQAEAILAGGDSGPIVVPSTTGGWLENLLLIRGRHQEVSVQRLSLDAGTSVVRLLTRVASGRERAAPWIEVADGASLIVGGMRTGDGPRLLLLEGGGASATLPLDDAEMPSE